MTIGMTFPVKDKKKTVPWGLVEAHRNEIQKAHGATLEYLAANGGVDSDALMGIIGQSAIDRHTK